MDDLVKMYFDFISDYDPYLSPQEIIENDLSDMLYNLVNIRKFNELEPDQINTVNEIIAAFEAAGIKEV